MLAYYVTHSRTALLVVHSALHTCGGRGRGGRGRSKELPILDHTAVVLYYLFTIYLVYLLFKILPQTIIMIQDYYALTLVRYLINLRVMSFTNCDIGGPFYIAYLFVAQSFILTECNNVSVTKKTTFHFRCQLSQRLTCATRKKCPW